MLHTVIGCKPLTYSSRSYIILLDIQVIRDAFSKKKVIMEKDDIAVDLVTETDQQCEKLIFTTLQNRYPSHGYSNRKI